MPLSARRFLWAFCAVLICLMTAGGAARAQSCTASFTSMPFGTNLDILPGAAIDTGVSTGTVTCTGLIIGLTARACIGMNFGSYASASPRQMATSGGARLNYDIFTDNARTSVWPSTTTSGPYVDLTYTSPSATITAYGRIYASQSSASVGAYLDSVVPIVRIGTSLSLLPSCVSILGSVTTLPAIAVSATIVANCSTSASTLDFGSHGLFSSDVYSSSGLSVTCTTNAPYWIALDDGLHVSGGGAARRRMASAGQFISYGLYRDGGYSQSWGHTQNSDTVSGTGTASATPFSVYGDIPPQNTPPPGAYKDTVTVTINF